jgi:hypothetical protein
MLSSIVPETKGDMNLKSIGAEKRIRLRIQKCAIELCDLWLGKHILAQKLVCPGG